jgi:hypothetical protein
MAMGTSKGYGLPTGGNWTPLKTEATKYANQEGRGTVSPDNFLTHYLHAYGGSKALAQGRGMSDRGKTGGAKSSGGASRGHGGGAARTSGRNFGGFLSTVSSRGLDEALREVGLENAIGKPPDQVAASLLDVLASPGSTLDEHAARLALAKVNDELLKNAKSYEDVATLFTKALDDMGLVRILASFFARYLFECFCRDFYETWVKKVGAKKAGRSLKSIKDFIGSRLKAKLAGRDVAKIDWRGREGLRITEQVMQDTLEIYEVTA